MVAIDNQSPIVTANWLFEQGFNPNLIIFDATIPKAGEAQTDIENQIIPGALFFDIKNNFSDTASIFPNTLPSTKQFEVKARELGVNQNSIIVIYDNKGVYSSARVWWMFKSMGHSNVKVLDGGFPEWKKQNHPIASTYSKPNHKGDFKANFNSEYFVNFDSILNASIQRKPIIIDARSEGRFKGTSPEPRKGLRGGHISNSTNLPFTTLFQNGILKNEAALTIIFSKFIDSKETPTIFSCGSGITACILALGAELAGFKHLSVYDGSWTEYATLTSKE